ncbi:MAG: HEAT repeat domain-containing protein, partial [Planctomycetota bacterium]
MYAPPTGLRALLLIALFLPAAAGLAQEGESIRELKVREVLSACDEARAAQIWEASEQLVQMGPPARRVLRKVYAEAPTEGKLAALRALIELDSTAYAAEKLIQLAEDESVGLQHRLLAIELIGQTEEEDAEEGLLDLLHTYNPQLQLASARALWNLDSPRKHEAKKVLRELLTSSNPDLQAQGALTLAEIGDAKTPGVRDTLLRLSREPGPRGRLAAALLDKLKLEKVIEFTASRSDEANATSRKKSPWSHLDEIRRILKEIYDFADEVEDDKLRTSAARGLLYFPQDPHTLFLSPDQYQEFLHGSEGVDPSYGGIGAFIDTNVKDRFRILRPIFGGPAWKADIRGGDDIVAVNGRPTAGRTTTDIIKDVKGPPGTPVILSIMRQGWRKPREITVIRAKIVLPTVT